MAPIARRKRNIAPAKANVPITISLPLSPTIFHPFINTAWAAFPFGRTNRFRAVRATSLTALFALYRARRTDMLFAIFTIDHATVLPTLNCVAFLATSDTLDACNCLAAFASSAEIPIWVHGIGAKCTADSTSALIAQALFSFLIL